MTAKLFLVLSFVAFWVSKCSRQISEVTQDNKSELIWSDEFQVDGSPSANSWSYDLGDGCPNVCGWGNRELEYYTDNTNNIRVENGNLVIEAHKENIGSKLYSSARLVSKNKFDWKYGKMEVRAKLPTGVGTWPAIWMLPTENKYGSWPRSGEIDIMEHVGHVKDTIYGTIHTDAYNHMKGTQKMGQIFVPDSEEMFHTYAINWTPEKIEWYIDNVMYHSVVNENLSSAEWPFDQKFHLILNLAIGGQWGGIKGIDESVFPQKMLVDYVRVYEL